jgi:hypothetical protein
MGAIRAAPAGTRLVPILPREYLPHDRLNSTFPKKSPSAGPPGMLLFGHAANDISTQVCDIRPHGAGIWRPSPLFFRVGCSLESIMVVCGN